MNVTDQREHASREERTDFREESQAADSVGDHPRNPEGYRGRDPTKMGNQPALQTSSGRIWIIMGALLGVAGLIPLGLLAFASSGRSGPVAIGAGAAVILLYATLLIARLAISRQKIRLRVMAACMLTMAATILVALWVCGLIESAPEASAYSGWAVVLLPLG